jgi:hypothetical protein
MNEQQLPSNTKRIQGIFTLILTVGVAFLVLGLAMRVGSGLIGLVEPEPADAAPVETVTATPEAPPNPTQPAPTPVPPTATPELMPTVEPTPIPPTPTPVIPRLVAGEGGVNVRRGPNTGYEKLGFLDPGAEALITGRYGDWWRIDYEDETAYVSGDWVTAFDAEGVPEVLASELPGPSITHPILEPAPAWAINEERWIDVDLSEQRVTAYEGQTPVQSYLVSTGLPATPTPVGQFRIWIKLRYDDMAGADYYLKDVPWVMYFYQGYGFHGVWWHANWGHPMSHGCINQPNEMAEWLFDFAEVGTLVNIHE